MSPLRELDDTCAGVVRSALGTGERRNACVDVARSALDPDPRCMSGMRGERCAPPSLHNVKAAESLTLRTIVPPCMCMAAFWLAHACMRAAPGTNSLLAGTLSVLCEAGAAAALLKATAGGKGRKSVESFKDWLESVWWRVPQLAALR